MVTAVTAGARAGAATSQQHSSAADSNDAVRSRYTKVKKVGEGTYASVFLAKDVVSGENVAIKKIKIGATPGNDGLDPTALREVGFLREMRCENVIALIDVFSSGSTNPSLNLVLEFLDTNMEALIQDRALIFTPADVKAWLAMMLRGLDYCHSMGCLHRDMKPNNLLISPQGVLKIADFGLARELAPPATRMTTQVITLWYRPPELLLGARHYSTGVDIWSAGAIFAEMMLRTPYMPGQETDASQLDVIFKARGKPTPEQWPGLAKLPLYAAQVRAGPAYPTPNHAQLFSAAGRGSVQLLNSMLDWDPAKRVGARDALVHPYFAKFGPRPTHPASELPRHKKKDDEVARGLLSDSKEKNAKRERGDGNEGMGGGGGGGGTDVIGAQKGAGPSAAAGGASLVKGAKVPRTKVTVTKEMIEERRRAARKLAFA
ncbi:unnamed protein product [Parajaminaea phylloscopi]